MLYFCELSVCRQGLQQSYEASLIPVFVLWCITEFQILLEELQESCMYYMVVIMLCIRLGLGLNGELLLVVLGA